MLRHTVLAVGRVRSGPLRDLFDDYVRRSPWPVQLIEVQSRHREPVARQRDEVELLLARSPHGARLVALDERGTDLPSEALAGRLDAWRAAGTPDVVWLIGGADGLGETARARADLVLAFGRQTWPHLLVRIMLAEQLYRAGTILAGHPYHRG